MTKEKALKLIEELGDHRDDGCSGATVYDACELAEAAGLHADTFLPLVDMYNEDDSLIGYHGEKEVVGVNGLQVLGWIADRLGLDIQCSATGRKRRARAIIEAIHDHFGVLA